MTVNRSLLFGTTIFSSSISPALQPAPAPAGSIIRAETRVLDAKTGTEAINAVLVAVPLPEKTGVQMVPHGSKLPVELLTPGSYRLEMTAMDGVAKPVVRTSDFQDE